MHSARVIIVGAGLVGPLLGMYLAKAGHKVDIYERGADPRQVASGTGRSINITLCGRGFAALADVGLESQVRSTTVPAYARVIHDDKSRLMRQPYSAQGNAIYSVSRSALNRILVEHAEKHFQIDFHFESECVDFQPSGPSATVLHRPSGSVSHPRAEVVFGVDGVHSSVRRYMQCHDLVESEEQQWNRGYKEILIPPGESGWLADREVLHLWPRGDYMMIAFPNVDGSFTGSLHLPFQGELSFESLRTESDLRYLLERSFPDMLEEVPNFTGRFFTLPIAKMTTVRCKPWSWEGKVILIGDAAHAIYPSYGQGTNASFEGCRLLQSLIKESADWKEAFSVYERLRRDDTDTLADLCIKHFEELGRSARDPLFQLRTQFEQRLGASLPEFIPLYSMITFTDMPYAEACALNRHQQQVLNRVLAGRSLDRLESSEFDELVATVKLGLNDGMHASCMPAFNLERL